MGRKGDTRRAMGAGVGFQNPVGCPGEGEAADILPEETQRRFSEPGDEEAGRGQPKVLG